MKIKYHINFMNKTSIISQYPCPYFTWNVVGVGGHSMQYVTQNLFSDTHTAQKNRSTMAIVARKEKNRSKTSFEQVYQTNHC